MTAISEVQKGYSGYQVGMLGRLGHIARITNFAQNELLKNEGGVTKHTFPLENGGQFHFATTGRVVSFLKRLTFAVYEDLRGEGLEQEAQDVLWQHGVVFTNDSPKPLEVPINEAPQVIDKRVSPDTTSDQTINEKLVFAKWLVDHKKLEG